ncbi:MAG TPA: protein kinase, partial [Urbifossiella sp.]|nr:protein kinase [Urbifossiella sp.]
MTDSSADRDPLDRLAEEFVSRLRRGEHPAIDDYAARHPELAEQVRELFPALVEMEQLKPAPGDHTGAFEAAADPTDPDRVGEFRILRRVGHGGMGVVYEAVQESLGRHVALKLLPAEAIADPKRLERFRREARAAARLHHTNIVPVFGVGEADGRHFYAMQFIPGHPLDAVITEVRRLKENSALLPAAPPAVSEVAGALLTGSFTAPPEGIPTGSSASPSPALSGTASGGSGYWATVARIGAQVADALAYAHGQGVLHRDVKPANLLLDPTGTVWVTDFGLAKSADADDLTHAGDIVGTLRYMAPERFDGAGDHRADVYALGLTLYELLTLRPAFSAENRAKLLQQVMDAHPPRPRSVSPSIPRDLETIVLKATARDPAARYQSAAALADDLRRFLDGRTITARRVGSAERLWRWAKRAPAVASLLVLTGVLLAAGTAVSVFFAVKADGERVNALAREKDADDARKDADTRADELKAEQEATAALLYASQAHQAGTAANEYRTARLLELLDETRPKPGKTDLRGWEWHYLDRLAHPWQSEVRLDTAGAPGFAAGRCTPAQVSGPPSLWLDSVGLTANATFSTDGTRLVIPPCAARDSAPGSVDSRRLPAVPGAVFDTGSGRVVNTLRPAALPPEAFSPLSRSNLPCWTCPGGRVLATAEVTDGENPVHRVRVTDVNTGREIRPPLVLGSSPDAVAVSPGAKRVLVVSGWADLSLLAPDDGEGPVTDWDRSMRIWEVDQAKPRVRMLLVPKVQPKA